MRKICFFLWLFLAATGIEGQIYTNTFTGTSACPTNGNSPSLAVNATGSPLSRNTITCSATANVFNSSTLNNTSGVLNTSYIEFSLAAANGFQLNITSLSFFRQGSNTAPNQMELRYSTDGFSSFISWNAPLTPTAGTVANWDMPDISVPGPAFVVFRFYPYGTQRCDLGSTPASAGGTLRLDDIIVHGTVTATSSMPVLSVSTLSAFGDTCLNIPVERSFTITGSNLSNANITVASLNGFTYSTVAGANYTSSLSLSQPGGAFSQTIYVLFTATAFQSYDGNIIIGGGGAADISVVADAGGFNSPPIVSSTAVTAISTGSATIGGFIDDPGCSAIINYGIEYSTINNFLNGEGIPAQAVNLNGQDFNVVLTGLVAGTTYYFKTFATNAAGISYSAIQRSFTTTAPGIVAAWDFTGINNAPTAVATNFDPNLVSINGANTITRGAGASPSTGANSFRTTGFGNDGISAGNADYFQVTLTAQQGYELSISTINAGMAGTASFAATPGVISQFAYSTDETNFTLIGSPVITNGTPVLLPQINTSTIPALQHIPAGTNITLRYYASGQTTTGGWGLFSPAAGVNGLSIGGTVSVRVSLPVKFDNVKVSPRGSTMKIEWSNLTESDMISYTIERSANGRNFTGIGEQLALMNNGERADYSFIDNNPVSGINYYRIRSTERSGADKYSIIVKLDTRDRSMQFSVSPNPVTTSQLNCQLTNLPPGKYIIRVFNTTGHEIHNESTNHPGGSASLQIQLPSNIKPGIYMLQLASPDLKLTARFHLAGK
jgi:hypothetical protein